MRDTNDEKAVKKEKIKKTAKNTVAVLLLLVLLIWGLELAGVIEFYSKPTKPVQAVQKLIDGILPGNTVKSGEMDVANAKVIKAGLQAKTDASTFTYKINVNPVFANGSAKGNLMIQNAKTNPFLEQVEIVDSTTNELMYKSPALKPGQYVQEDKLIKNYPKGTYECIAYFNLYDAKTKEFVNKNGFRVTLTILN